MTRLENLLVTDVSGKLFLLFLAGGSFLFLLLLLYFGVTVPHNKRTQNRVLSHNEKLGVPLRYDVGWTGARIIPVPFPRDRDEKGAPPQGDGPG